MFYATKDGRVRQESFEVTLMMWFKRMFYFDSLVYLAALHVVQLHMDALMRECMCASRINRQAFRSVAKLVVT